MHPHYGALPDPDVPVRVTRGAAIAHRTLTRLLAAEPHSTSGLLLPCRYLYSMILVTPYSMVSYSLPFCILLFFLYLISFHGNEIISLISFPAVVGLGLRTDRVLIAVSQPCIANIFFKKIFLIRF